MRDILFKAKRLDNGKWIEGNVFFAENGKCEICVGIPTIRITHAVDPQTVCQYTGQTDKNGKKIFEKDIAKLPAYLDDEIAFCSWIDNNSSVEYVTGFAFVKKDGSIIRSDEWEDFEIVGNVFDMEKCS